MLALTVLAGCVALLEVLVTNTSMSADMVSVAMPLIMAGKEVITNGAGWVERPLYDDGSLNPLTLHLRRIAGGGIAPMTLIVIYYVSGPVCGPQLLGRGRRGRLLQVLT